MSSKRITKKSIMTLLIRSQRPRQKAGTKSLRLIKNLSRLEVIRRRNRKAMKGKLNTQ